MNLQKNKSSFIAEMTERRRNMDKVYIAIDLKSFYASCECVQRGLDPLDTNLVVADMSRTEKTICLAVTPPLKSFGISGRARLFEVIQRVGQVNRERARRAPRGQLTGKSCIYSELAADPSLALDYIVAPPQMAHYMDVSARIYGIYLRYVAPEDIFAYSVDEVFIDATGYLSTYKTDGHGFARMLIQAVLAETGGVRIAELNEQSYKENWWSHTPITDFWRVGKGISARLENLGIHTMGDIAVWSLDRYHIGRLYKTFGKNAELLIDHAWGVEPTTIADVKAYKPSSSSITSGQVLQEPCDY